MKISSLASFTFVIGVTLLSVACKSESSSKNQSPTTGSAGRAVAPAQGGEAEDTGSTEAELPMPETLRLPRRYVAVGTACTRTTVTKAESAQATSDGASDSSFTLTGTARQKVLAVENATATRFLATFSGDGAKPILDGITFEVWREQGSLKAKLADGANATAKQIAALNEEVLIDERRGMDAFLASRDWTMGERYTLTAKDLATLKDSDPWESMFVTLTASANSMATFWVEAKIINTSSNANIVIDAKGEVQVQEKTGIVELVNLTAVVTGAAPGMPTTMREKQTIQCDEAK